MKHRLKLAGALLAVGCGTFACFGARPSIRSYFVLHGEPLERAADGIRGTVRVRNLDSDSIYEKFQIVVRKSPYELRYSDQNVWAVKPNQMVGDIIARTLAEAGTFNAVTRTLGDSRPDYTLAGELHAIEIYDSDDLWFSHLSMSLWLVRFDTGERLWSMGFDERKLIDSLTFSHAVRGLSELLQGALRLAIAEIETLELERARNQTDEGLLVPTSTRSRDASPRRRERRRRDPVIVPESRLRKGQSDASE